MPEARRQADARQTDTRSSGSKIYRNKKRQIVDKEKQVNLS